MENAVFWRGSNCTCRINFNDKYIEARPASRRPIPERMHQRAVYEEGVRHFVANRIEPLSLTGRSPIAEPEDCVTHAFSCYMFTVTVAWKAK